MLDSESRIIKNAIRGEASAFGLLYDRYQPKIYRFIYLKVSHREEAEDLTHQVFLNCWQNISDYTFQGFPFSAWLYRIARNQVIDHYRTKKIYIDIEDCADDLKTDDQLPKFFDRSLDLESVKNAIRKLNQDQQDIVIMRFVEDLSPKEIAIALDKKPEAVRLIQHRAIQNLKKILNQRISNLYE